MRTPWRDALIRVGAATAGDSVRAVHARLEATVTARPTDLVAQFELASLDRYTYRHEAARRRLRPLLRATGPAAEGLARYAHFTLASSFIATSEADSSEAHARVAARLASEAGDRRLEVSSLLMLVTFASRRSRADSADALLQRAEVIVPASAPGSVARVRCRRAMLLRYDAPARADSVAGLGLATARRHGEREAETFCLWVRGNVLNQRGRTAEAVDVLREAERLARATHDDEMLANVLQSLGQYSLAIAPGSSDGRRAITEAIEVSRRTRNPYQEAFSLLTLAQLSFKLGELHDARRIADDVEARMRRLDETRGLLSAHAMQGEIGLLEGRFASAYAYFERGAQLARKAGSDGLRSDFLREQAIALRGLGQLGPAAAHLAAATELTTKLKLEWQGPALEYERGLEALAARRWDTAVRHLQRTAEAHQGATHMLYDVHLRLAEAHAGAGRLDAAERELEAAAERLTEARAAVTDRASRLALLQGWRLDFDTDLGLATTVNILARAGRVAPTLAAVENHRAQQLWRQTLRRSAVLGLAADSAPPVGGSVAEARLDDLPEVLPDSTALAVFVTGRGGEPTTLIVVTRRGVAAVTLTAGDSLWAPIERFSTLLAAGNPAPALARSLGVRLLDPLLRAAGPATTHLVIVPDGPLHRLPFDALALADGSPALERYRITIAPSARIARQWWTRPPPPERHGVLAFADPAYDPRTDLIRLSASGNEGRELRSYTQDVRLLTREAASEAALKRAPLQNLGVLHLATHARVHDFSLQESALYLAPGDGEDGRVGAEELAALRLGTDLVVLSACRTVGGPILSGEGVQGLTAPLLEAGARAVAATYWEVGDQSIGAVIGRLYAELSAGRSVGDALWWAKRLARADGASVGVWAAFTLVGDPSARPRLERTGPGPSDD